MQKILSLLSTFLIGNLSVHGNDNFERSEIKESNQSKVIENSLTWNEFAFNSETEKTFWNATIDWTNIEKIPNFPRSSTGEKIDQNSTLGFSGYAKQIHNDWNLRIIYLLKNGWVIKSKSWDQNGKVRTQRHYKNGKLHGSWTGWHENGQKQIEFSWAHGVPVGRSISWHENGKISETGNYQSGKMHGEWITYQFDGTEKDRLSYNLGEIVTE